MDLKVVGLKYLVPVTVLLLYFCTCYRCHPVPVLYTTTPRVYSDRFILKKQHGLVKASNTSFNDKNPLGFSSGLMIDPQIGFEFENSKKSLDKVKAVNLGEKTMRQSDDDDDDDDDDGGEYSGLDGSCSSTGVKSQDSVPMMIIREMDMMALEIPVKSKDKNEKSNDKDEKRKDFKIFSNSNIKELKQGMKSFQSRWKPASHEDEHSERKERPGNSQNIISDNSFGVKDRGLEYEFDNKREDNIGFRSFNKKRGIPYDTGRRDLDYILDSKRGQSARWNHRPSEGHMFYSG